MKVRNMPERVERRRARAATRAGVGRFEEMTTDVTLRRGRNKRVKVARKFMGPKAAVQS